MNKTLIAPSIPVASDDQETGSGTAFDLEQCLSRTTSKGRDDRNFGVVLGEVVGVDQAGRPLVRCSGFDPDQPIACQTLSPVRLEDIGRQAALMFPGGDASRPLLMGLVQTRVKPDEANSKGAPLPELSVIADESRVEIRAEREIVLRCGKASITLTRAGKILLRGAYVLSRSSGVNRIKGGSVQIN